MIGADADFGFIAGAKGGPFGTGIEGIVPGAGNEPGIIPGRGAMAGLGKDGIIPGIGGRGMPAGIITCPPGAPGPPGGSRGGGTPLGGGSDDGGTGPDGGCEVGVGAGCC